MKPIQPTPPSPQVLRGKPPILLLIATILLAVSSLHAQRTNNRAGVTQQNLISTEFNNRTEWRLVITPYKQGNLDRQNSVPVKPGVPTINCRNTTSKFM